MRSPAGAAREALLPFAVFVATVLVHYLWAGRAPEPAAMESPWASLPSDAPSPLARYVEAGDYWLGYSYGLSLAFAATALRVFVRGRSAASGGFALGGLTFSGVLAAGGCYLLGCCGSPMLVVYLNLFGAGYLPFAKPLLAALTTVSILGAWWWMARVARKRAACFPASTCGCG
jgi:hypothetical protein